MTQPQPAKSDLNSPILSVLLPVRQRPLFLKRTISSILFQSFRNWELVVLLDRDDGSNREIISKLITENDVVFIDVDILRDGFAHALNLGVVFCRGEYIARCDDDDLSVATRFEEQVCHLENDVGVNAPESRWPTMRLTCPNRLGEACRWPIIQPVSR